jgi:branched-chain amino acid transport system substrate-binding protein
VNRMYQLAAAAAIGALVQAGAAAAEDLTIGMITTLSGPGAGLGVDIRDGFNLAVDDLGGKFGAFEAKIIEVDDQQKPDVAVQLTERLLSRDGADIITGTVWSNLALAMLPVVVRADKIHTALTPGPRSSPAASATGTSSTPRSRTTPCTRRPARWSPTPGSGGSG